MQDWGEHFRVSLIGVVGFSITGSTLDQWLRIGIACATLVYMSFKAASAVRGYYNNKNEEEN